MNRMPYVLLFIISLTSFSCKKEKDNSSGCILSPTSILGTYKLTGYTTQQSATSPVLDEYATWQPCEKDDVVTLNADGTYKRVDAGMTCFSPAEIINGTWSLNGNSFTNDGVLGTIETFDCHTLIISTN